MTGMFVIHPRKPAAGASTATSRIMLHEWRIDPGAKRPEPERDDRLQHAHDQRQGVPRHGAARRAQAGERVRIRIGNLGADGSPPDPPARLPVHGSPRPTAARSPSRRSGRRPRCSCPSGSTRTIEFVADEPGDWAMHCHMTHHVMNQMGHGAAQPDRRRARRARREASASSLPGYMTMGQTGMGDMGEMGMPVPDEQHPDARRQGTHDYITMGGMFTILKVRDGITSYDDPGLVRKPGGHARVHRGGDRSASRWDRPNPPARRRERMTDRYARPPCCIGAWGAWRRVPRRGMNAGVSAA